MNTENKELLLKDLCTRLPYGVICKILFVKEKLKADYIKYLQKDTTFQIKPYLRPMSSMTEEEQNEFDYLRFRHNEEGWLDFVLSRHLDWRDLIEKGLALEAPEGMYNTKTE